jgi:hypothetical protein
MKLQADHQEVNERQKRIIIKLYFERIKKYNATRKGFQLLIIILSFCSFILLFSGSFIAFLVYFSLLCIVYYFSLPRLPVPEKVIDIWFKQDQEELLKKAQGKLDVEVHNLDIPFWNGIYKDTPEEFKDSPDFNDVFDQKFPEDESDYFDEEGVDKKRRFGVYAFGSIFLCSSFLAYYKCTWNFVRGASTNDEFSEYLYVTIASVRYSELSSSKRQTSKINKRILNSSFIITTTDSKETRFTFTERHKVSYKFDPYISDLSDQKSTEAQKAVEKIREQIRKMRPDYQITKPLDSDFGR